MQDPYAFNRCVRCGYCWHHSRVEIEACLECGGKEWVDSGGPWGNARDEKRQRRHKVMFLAQQKTRAAALCGLLPALDGTVCCVDCGQVAMVYDHRDYWKPLEAEPVCHRCNTRRGPGQTLPPAERG